MISNSRSLDQFILMLSSIDERSSFFLSDECQYVDGPYYMVMKTLRLCNATPTASQSIAVKAWDASNDEWVGATMWIYSGKCFLRSSLPMYRKRAF